MPAALKRARALPLLLLALLALLIWRTQPAPVPDLRAIAGQPGSIAVLVDARGRELARRRTDAAADRGDWLPLAAISPDLVRRLVAAEDRRFWQHHGIDWRSVGGAALGRLRGAGARGASTITMQLAALLDPALGRAGGRGWRAKLRQARAARAIEARWSKRQILEAWLNLLPLRGDVVGIGAAATRMAGRPAAALGPAENAVLVALARRPSAPAAAVLARACRAAPDLDCPAIALAAARLLGPRQAASGGDLAPHLAARLLRPGVRGRVATSLDADVQAQVQAALDRQLAALAGRNVRDGAALVVDNDTGRILAWVGAAGSASRAAQVDGVAAPRQAGSTLKPHLFALAIERRLLTAASLLDDAPVDLETATGLYIPQNYDRRFRGPVSVRSALGNSLNVPAVRTLLLTGLEAFRQRLFDLGYRGINRPGDFYGYALALGSAEVTLLEQAAAYRSLALGGRGGPLTLDPDARPATGPIVDAGAAAIVTALLADPAARAASFGEASGLSLPFAAAVKTGTSKAMRDNWAVGFSRRFTVAVWVGNFEGDAMIGVSGTSGAAPAWAAIMQALHADPPPDFALPASVERRPVRFRPAVEPPRQELFLPGTWQPLFALAAPDEEAVRLTAPSDGTILALDPDIPAGRQLLVIRSTGQRPGLFISVDGRRLPGRPARWAPVPGRHEIALGDGRTIFDRVRITVR
ncbi:MAG: transglycosylase domain-containing protein [Alphaproteobacteria bacterium]|nr:transglycosylase domain-containing protein [Alphaproteobacteria bacterium]